MSYLVSDMHQVHGPRFYIRDTFISIPKLIATIVVHPLTQALYVIPLFIRGQIEKLWSWGCISAKISLIQIGFDTHKEKRTEIRLFLVEKCSFLCLTKTIGQISHENQRYYVFISWKNATMQLKFVISAPPFALNNSPWFCCIVAIFQKKKS